MSASRFNDVPESPDERMQRRRARRWKRRMRMAGPFLGIPLLVGMLALSVDLIEYDPEPEPERLSDRPIPKAVTEKAAARRAAPSSSARAVSGASVVETSARDFAPAASPSPDLELQLEGEGTPEKIHEFAPPSAPYALRGGKY